MNFQLFRKLGTFAQRALGLRTFSAYFRTRGSTANLLYLHRRHGSFFEETERFPNAPSHLLLRVDVHDAQHALDREICAAERRQHRQISEVPREDNIVE